MNTVRDPRAAEAAAHRRGAERRAVVLLYAAVAFGSVIGSLLRWGLSVGSLEWLGAQFPWGTLFANVTGSLAIGFYSRLSGPDGRLFASSRMRHFIMTGVCGGYTTFSIFSLETLRLAEAGAMVSAGLYIVASTMGWFAAVWIGDAFAARINRLKGASS